MNTKDNEDNTYSVSVYCTNCGFGSSFSGYDIEVLKGITIKNALYTDKCPNCGCKSLAQKIRSF